MDLLHSSTKARIVDIDDELDSKFKALQQEKKHLQQGIVINVVTGILRKRGLKYTKDGNVITVRTDLGPIVVRCANYFDTNMNRDTMDREAKEHRRYVVVVGHEVGKAPTDYPYFNLTGTKRGRGQDLYRKTMVPKVYNALDNFFAGYVPVV